MGVCKTVTLLTAVGAAVLAVYMYSALPPEVTEAGKAVMFKAVFIPFNLIGSTYEALGYGAKADLLRKIGVRPALLVSDSHLDITDTSFSGVQVRVYKPRAGQEAAKGNKMAGLMYFHGGGWVLSSGYAYDPLVGRIAKETGAVVVSVEYRLAPKHKFPTPFQDCVAATEHFLQHASEYGADPTRIGVVGDSSGGNLAAAVALKLAQDKTKLPPLKLQALVNPALQAFDFQTPSYFRGYTHHVNLPPKLMIGFWIQYLNNNVSLIDKFSSNGHTAALRKSRFATYVDRHLLNESLPKVTPEDVSIDLPDDIKDILNPYYAPLMAEDADLSGLPNTYIVVCGIDVLRDDGIMYAKRLEMAGVQVKLAHYPSGFHGIMTMNLALKHFEFEIGKQMLQGVVAFVRDHL